MQRTIRAMLRLIAAQLTKDIVKQARQNPNMDVEHAIAAKVKSVSDVLTLMISNAARKIVKSDSKFLAANDETVDVYAPLTPLMSRRAQLIADIHEGEEEDED